MTDTPGPISAPAFWREPAIGWILAYLAPLLALLFTRPWVAGAFPVWDFSEMLPLLRSTDSVAAAWMALVEFTAKDGRANYLTYLQIALTWWVAGEDALVWQWQRAIFMLTMGVCLVWTVRRCGGTPPAAAAAALLVILSVSGADGWVLLMGEPLVVILLCTIIIVGQGIRSGAVDHWRIACLAITSASVILTKEVAIVLLPSALALGLGWHPNGTFALNYSRETRWRLGGWVTSACGLASLPFLVSVAGAGSSGYVSGYSFSGDGLARVPTLAQALIFPTMYFRADMRTALYPANLTWLVALCTALVVVLLKRSASRHGAMLVSLLTAIPLAGAVVYAFWPRYSPFYGIPFMIGSAGLLAAALTVLHRRLPLGGIVATAFAAVISCYAGIIAYQIVNERRAFADLAHSAASALAADTTADSILVVKPLGGRNRWPITAAELGRYAIAIGLPAGSIPTLVDVSCEVAAARLGEPAGRTGFLNDQNTCGPLPTSTLRLVAVAQRVDWVDWTSSDDSLVIQLLFPNPPQSASPTRQIIPPDTAAGSATAPAGP